MDVNGNQIFVWCLLEMYSSKKEEDYPLKEGYQSIKREAIQIGTRKLLLSTYEDKRYINLFIGGHDKWCINCELIKEDNTVKPMGYLLKIRYDMLCTLEHNMSRGYDTKQMMIFLIQYIHNTYPAVKELSLNDLSTKTCDNQFNVNLAVMTYLYSGKTWYEKNFGAYISPQSASELKKAERRLQNSKQIPWTEMKDVIKGRDILTEIDEKEFEDLYRKAETWKDFFEPIYKKIEIADFCVFISSWIDKFILHYFNNLQGFTYIIPIKDYRILYEPSEYKRGGRRFTKKAQRRFYDGYWE